MPVAEIEHSQWLDTLHCLMKESVEGCECWGWRSHIWRQVHPFYLHSISQNPGLFLNEGKQWWEIWPSCVLEGHAVVWRTPDIVSSTVGITVLYLPRMLWWWHESTYTESSEHFLPHVSLQCVTSYSLLPLTSGTASRLTSLVRSGFSELWWGRNHHLQAIARCWTGNMAKICPGFPLLVICAFCHWLWLLSWL